MSTVITVLITAIIAYLTYSYFAIKLQEIDPELLNYQSSISETRQENESAVYRSVDAPHGISVTRGLNLRSGYKIRDGTLKDVWQSGMKKNEDCEIIISDKVFKIAQINRIIHLLGEKIKNDEKIAVYGDLTETPELLLAIWSAFFVSDSTVVFYSSEKDLLTNTYKIDTVFTQTKDANLKSTFKNVITFNFDTNIENIPECTETINITESHPSSTESLYDPEIDFDKVNNNPFIIINGGHETKFYQLNFVSAIASKIMSIPSLYTWKEEDKLLISYNNSGISAQINVIFHSCTGIISNAGKIQFISPSKIQSLKKISELKPSILCIDTNILKKLCTSSKKSFIQSFILQRSEFLNAKGYSNSFGKIAKNMKLKTVFAAQLNPPLSSFICNFCKSVLGCKIVREIYTSYSIGPILKTNIHDFRIVHNKSLALFGVPANSVELKTVNSEQANGHSRLYVRGMSVGKSTDISQSDEMWVDTGINGVFARDGCFYGESC